MLVAIISVGGCSSSKKGNKAANAPMGKGTNWLVASIAQMPCRMNCPHYEAYFYSDGRLKFVGYKNVPKQGTVEYVIPVSMLEQILADAKKINYKALAKVYPGAEDFPGTFSSVTIGGKEYRAETYASVPETLKEFHKKLSAEVFTILAEQSPIIKKSTRND